MAYEYDLRLTIYSWQVVALMQAGRFAETLKQIDASKHQLDLDFEVAYCHYRLNDPRKALAVLDGVANPQVFRHLPLTSTEVLT